MKVWYKGAKFDLKKLRHKKLRLFFIIEAFLSKIKKILKKSFRKREKKISRQIKLDKSLNFFNS